MQKTLIYLTLLIEVLGISIIIPAYPELKIYYGISDFQVLFGLVTYSLFAFASAPILGQRSDKIGRKISLTRCIAGTTLSYFILLIQPRYWIFLLTRALNGITGGNISIIQAIITDISPDQESKNKNFGLLGAMFGLGFIIGPVVGSLLLSRGGVEAIFRGGGIIAGGQFILFLLKFKNTNNIQATKIIQRNPFVTIRKYLKKPALAPWLLSFMALGFGAFIINSAQSLYMLHKFGTSGIQYGYYLAGIGIISAINMAYLIPNVRMKYLSTKHILLIVYISLLLGYTILSFLPTEQTYILFFLVVVLCSGAYGMLYNIHIMSQAAPDEVGEISGMFGSIQSIAMIIGPLFGGILLEYQIDIHYGSLIFFLIASILFWGKGGVLFPTTSNHVSNT